MTSMPRRTQRCAAPTLRVGSHNVRGLGNPLKAAAAALLWTQQKLDVILLQETKLSIFSMARITASLKGWKRAYWCHGRTSAPPDGSEPRPARGVAILVRDGCPLVVDEGSIVRLHSGADAGNLIHLKAKWGGHRLHIASIYLPNEPTQQKHSITTQLQPLKASLPAGTKLLWGGDFNFAPDVSLDRVSRVANITNNHPDTGVQRVWEHQLPDLLDAYRTRHPTTRSYTHFSPTSAARLDRFFVCGDMQPYVAFAGLSAAGHISTDHRLVNVAILRQPGSTDALPPGATSRPTPAIRRVRLGFAEDPQLLGVLHQWVAGRLQHAPGDAAALLNWWPTFKRALARRCFALAYLARAQHRAAIQGATAALDALYLRVEQGDYTALADIMASQRACSLASVAAEAEHPGNQRHKWLHHQELPNPYITHRLQTPRAAHEVPGLRWPGGGLATTPKAIAKRAAQFWAGVSAQPATVVAAQEEVLAALADSPTIAHPLVAALGDTTISEEELVKALRQAPRGKAPGADGLPVELYCKLPALLPLMTRVLTAAGEQDRLPPGLHEGVITLIFKAGDKLDPANYRPITLLNTDYRLLAKVLANRLKLHLPAIISREQTAFIPGRNMGENVMLLQLLPHLLRLHGRSAYAVFCDFRKAYDTVDRGFLLRIMEQLGVGPGFLAWARLLLRDTRSKALVNGHLSGPAAFEAGVRQGCPLAPLLYLFIGQALLCFLKARGVGIDLAGLRLSGVQYADDLEAFLGSLEEIPAFMAAMDTFRKATGQELNPGKTVVLPVGLLVPGTVGYSATTASPPVPATTAHGLAVRDTAKALGITFCCGTKEPHTDWPAQLAKLRERFTKLADFRKKLSAFGRGFGSAAYGVSTFLFYAEFTGLPEASTLTEINRLVAKLVSQGQPPDGPNRFSGIRADLVAGSPKDGGYGGLHWEANIRARHATWGRRFCTERNTPWALVGRAVLAPYAAHDHPLTLVAWAHDTAPAAASLLPPPLARLLSGLRHLPRPKLQQIPPGDWCRYAPLFGNPYLPNLDSLFPAISRGRIQTVGEAIQIWTALNTSVALTAYWLGMGATTAQIAYAKSCWLQLASHIPPSWMSAVYSAPGGAAPGSAAMMVATASAADSLLAGVTWESPTGGDAIPLSDLTVKAATMLHGEVVQCQAERRLRFAGFANLAGDVSPADVAVKRVRAMMGRLWRGPCKNKYKEVMWRLIMDGLPLASRMSGTDLGGCACGHTHPVPDRRHHYWECPIAKGVLGAVAAQLPPSQPPLLPSHLWLAQAPPAIHAGVWDMVCLLAVAAMDKGRRQATRTMLNAASPIGGAELATAAARRAAAWFWQTLEEVCSLGRIPATWQSEVDPAHPFITWQAADQRWSARRPL